jgi:hypothetical protein
MSSDQRHRDRRPSTPACQVAGWWDKKAKNCAVRKIIFCTGLTRAKAGQKSLVPAQGVQRTNQGRTPFICTLWVPIHRQQGPPLSSLSGSDTWFKPPHLLTTKERHLWTDMVGLVPGFSSVCIILTAHVPMNYETPFISQDNSNTVNKRQK